MTTLSEKSLRELIQLQMQVEEAIQESINKGEWKKNPDEVHEVKTHYMNERKCEFDDDDDDDTWEKSVDKERAEKEWRKESEDSDFMRFLKKEVVYQCLDLERKKRQLSTHHG